MNTKTDNKIADIIRVAEILSLKTQKNRSTNVTSLPKEISFKITTRCNFRCKHCYLWNKNGYYRQFDRNNISQDIDLEIIDKVLFDTRKSNAAIIISGGEPLFHNKWYDIVEILLKYNRKISLFTNGFYINKHIEQLLKISKNLNLVISIDGIAPEHDNIRGKNTFSKIIQNIRLLSGLKKKNIFKGNITINTFLSNELALNLSEYIQFVNTLKPDKLFFNFPWFIDESDAVKMDNFYTNYFAGLCDRPLPCIPSWHTFTYHLTYDILRNARSVLKSHREMILGNNIRINPFSEYKRIIGDNLPGYSMLKQIPVFCVAVTKTMIVQSDGMVTACTAFPELEIEPIRSNDIKDIWNSEKYNSIRKILYEFVWPGTACLKCPFLSSNFYNL